LTPSGYLQLISAVFSLRFSHPAALKIVALLAGILASTSFGQPAFYIGDYRPPPLPPPRTFDTIKIGARVIAALSTGQRTVAPAVVTAPDPVFTRAVLPEPAAGRAASPATGAKPEADGWKQLPMDVRREVDAFFINLELATNYSRLDLVMALYTSDAVEVTPDGNHLVLAGIRQNRQEEMARLSKAGLKAATVQRNYLLYKPAAPSADFKVIYPVRAAGLASAGRPSAENIIYTFRRGATGLQLSSTVVYPADGGKGPSGQADVPDDAVPTEIRLTNGARLRQVKVLHWAPDTLLIQYVGGTVPIRLVNIQAEDRAHFIVNLDRQIKLQNDAALAYARASVQRAQAEERMAQNQATQAAQQQESQSERDARIDEAIANHRLMLGMSTDEVRRSWTTPTEIDTFECQIGQVVLWTYGGRGAGTSGIPVDASVAFVDDQVKMLIDVRPRDLE
jgi:hypothetical protein